MGRSRAWWRCFLAVQAAVIVLTLRSVTVERARINSSQRMLECWQGFPVIWNTYATDLPKISGMPTRYYENRGHHFALPVLLVLLALTVPWTALNWFSFPRVSRGTKLIRVVGLASIASLVFSLGDIVTGYSPLQPQYCNSRTLQPVIQNQTVAKALERIRIARFPETRSDPDALHRDPIEFQSRMLAVRTFWEFEFSLAVCLMIVRPWRRIDPAKALNDSDDPPPPQSLTPLPTNG